MVAAKRDQSRVLATKFRQDQLTLKGRSAVRDTQTSRLVFTARLRPQFRTSPFPNAPSSECPRASIAARRRAAGSIRICRRGSCCCSSATAGIAIGANFKVYLLRQFCSNRVDFSQYTGDTDAKKWWTRILKFELWFLRIFDIIKKASRGPSAADLDHYGRSQTRSKSRSVNLATKFRQNRLTMKGRSTVEVPVRDTQTSRLVFTARLRPLLRTLPVRNGPELRSLHAAAPPVQSEYPAERRATAAVPLPESP